MFCFASLSVLPFYGLIVPILLEGVDVVIGDASSKSLNAQIELGDNWTPVQNGRLYLTYCSLRSQTPHPTPHSFVLTSLTFPFACVNRSCEQSNFEKEALFCYNL